MAEIEYTKLKVEELRELIVKDGDGKVKLEDVDKIKGKKALVEMHQKLVTNDVEGFFKELKEINEDLEPKPVKHVKSEDAPSYTDPGWETFLMSQLTDEEKSGDCPKVNGLRRLAETFLGEILFSGPIEYQNTRLNDNTDKTTVLYEVHISWNRDIIETGLNGGDPTVRKFRALGSSSMINTDTEYAAFGESVADTRSEARALRRALRINRVSSDEMTRKDTVLTMAESMPQIDMNKITDTQKETIQLLCDRLGIELNKYINSGKSRHASLDEVPRATAAAMIQRLNDFQSVSDKSIAIPEDLKVKNEG